MPLSIHPPGALPLRRKLWFDLNPRHGLYLGGAFLVGVITLLVHLSLLMVCLSLLFCGLAVGLAVPLPSGLHGDEWLLQVAQYTLQRAKGRWRPLPKRDATHLAETDAPSGEQSGWWKEALWNATDPVADASREEGDVFSANLASFDQEAAWDDDQVRPEEEPGWVNDWAILPQPHPAAPTTLARYVPLSRSIVSPEAPPASPAQALAAGLVWEETLDSSLDKLSARFLLDQRLPFATSEADVWGTDAAHCWLPPEASARIIPLPRLGTGAHERRVANQ